MQVETTEIINLAALTYLKKNISAIFCLLDIYISNFSPSALDKICFTVKENLSFLKKKDKNK